jgi:hypothetical protein
MPQRLADVILNERGPERFTGPEERQLFGVGLGAGSEESAFPNLDPEDGPSRGLENGVPQFSLHRPRRSSPQRPSSAHPAIRGIFRYLGSTKT